MDRKEYDVFISYSRKDYVDDKGNVIPGNVVSEIKAALKAAGISYWIDEEANYVSEAWAKFILNCIKSSKIIVFVASKNANHSEWTRKEIAAANEFRKTIIPFRIDESHYDEDVFLRLVDLQYIAHYKNPDTSLDELVVAVKNNLMQIKEKEEIRKSKKQEQKDIEAIRLACSKLNNKEAEFEVERSNLLLEAKAKVKDPAELEELINDIISSSPIRKKSEQEIQQLKDKIENLSVESNHSFRWWIHLIYVIIIAVLFFGWLGSNSENKELQRLYTDQTTNRTTVSPIKTDTTITKPTTPRQASDMEVYSRNLKKYRYTGPLNADGKPEGKGSAIFPNKDTFEGTFINGRLVEGRYTFANDGTYFLGTFNEKEEPDTAHGAYYNKNGKKIN